MKNVGLAEYTFHEITDKNFVALTGNFVNNLIGGKMRVEVHKREGMEFEGTYKGYYFAVNSQETHDIIQHIRSAPAGQNGYVVEWIEDGVTRFIGTGSRMDRNFRVHYDYP